MDHADDGDDVFVYMGGNQVVPLDVTHVRVHQSVKIITRGACGHCRLVSIEMHDGVEIIEEYAFNGCRSLRTIKLTGVKVIENFAFINCRALTDVEFGEKLKTIGNNSFQFTSLRNINIPTVRNIGKYAFGDCEQLTEVELPEDLEGIEGYVFQSCPRLRRIAIPLKDNLLGNDYVFNGCYDLSQVDLIGGIHKTISSLLLDSWKNETKDEIDSINQDLPNIPADDKTAVIQYWMETVVGMIDDYKSEHHTLLKEFTTLLELALWKAKLDESQDERALGSDQPAKKAKIDTDASRQELRITSGANIVIKNVLPFLKLE